MEQREDIDKKLKKKRRAELFAYFREISREEGFFAALRRTLKFFRRRYGMKRGRFLPKKSELAAQRSADVAGWPRISVCVPVYNPTRQHFDEFVASVVGQTYPNWELCLANASDDPLPISEIVDKYADDRITARQMVNEGIAENTNRAVALSRGDYILFADHDDILSPNALYEVARAVSRSEAEFLYGDEALFENDYLNPTAAHFKPDYSPQYLLNCNYIGHPVAVKKDLFNRVEGLRSKFDGSQDYDFNLRALDKTHGIHHIQKVLYYWRQHEESTSIGVEAKPYVTDAAKSAIYDHLQSHGIRATVTEGLFPSTYKVNYAIKGRPLISIIIPNCDHVPDLDRCIRSIYEKTKYKQFEILIVENNSHMVETFSYYQELTRIHPECRVLVYEGEGFNFSRICNFGRKSASGSYLLYLNNDTDVITPEWLDEMVQLCQLEEVGIVGSMLYYPDDTVQHAGIIVGLGGYAGHSHKYALRGRSGYMFRQACVQELSAVTGACMMVKAKVFDEVGGFDPGFSVAYNDVDFCLRARRRGHSVVFTPYAELYHHESKSRGTDEEGEAAERFAKEQERLLDRYGDELLKDPYYSPWLTLDQEDFSENDVLPES